jgi:KipI family sensor histidine kinase inhibitor
VTRTLARFGGDAILVTEPGEPGARLLAACRSVPGVIEAVAGADSVLLTFADWDHARSAVPAIASAPLPEPGHDPGAVAKIGIRYDGVDLPDIAANLGLAIDDVISLHAEGEYQVAFCGFAPGFAYLIGLHPSLRLPRRSSPRPRVPAGSVAIADAYCGIYPRSTPGGWHILGTTDAVLFDPLRDPPALLTAGMRVRFVQVAR